MPPKFDPIDIDVEKVGRISVVPRILEVICETTGMGFAAVARVTESRWVACAVKDEISFGLAAGGELEIKTTICDEIREVQKAVIIEDVDTDPVFCNHHTPATYGFKSYISAPIFEEHGGFFGTLCAIDPKPRRLDTPAIRETFALFAELIGVHLGMQDRLHSTETALLDEREQGKLREQFIAVLGHDLRNPLSSITSSANYLQHTLSDAKPRLAANMIVRSAARMANLVNNLTDFAQARLGGGFNIKPKDAHRLQEDLEHVVSEMREAWPDQTIETNFALDGLVQVDSPRVAQLLSNLLGNALAHGSPDHPVAVRACTDLTGLVLSVSNQGKPIEASRLPTLFEPFVRGTSGHVDGLGLGLYIVKEIVTAHGGKVEVISTDQETRFTTRIPGINPDIDSGGNAASFG